MTCPQCKRGAPEVAGRISADRVWLRCIPCGHAWPAKGGQRVDVYLWPERADAIDHDAGAIVLLDHPVETVRQTLRGLGYALIAREVCCGA